MSHTLTISGFDLHCHVDLHPDPPAFIRRCEEERVAVLAVTTTPRAWRQNQRWMVGSAFVHAAVGLHPELVGERYSEAAMLEELIGRCRLVGEVGLDGSPQHKLHFEKQKDVFVRALTAAAKHGRRVMTIHSRRAEADVISLINEHTSPERVTCILHWFSGTKAQMRRAAEIGTYFSVNEAMLNSQRGRSLVAEMPLERLLTESDAPFVNVNGKPSHPVGMKRLLSVMADARAESLANLQNQVDKNSSRVFAAAGIQLN